MSDVLEHTHVMLDVLNLNQAHLMLDVFKLNQTHAMLDVLKHVMLVLLQTHFMLVAVLTYTCAVGCYKKHDVGC